ncbi:MAG: hypothetical protein WCJ70_03040 [bacterium]
MEESVDQILLSWKAPLRPFKKQSAGLLRFFLAVALLLSLILFFVGDMVTLLPMWALLFLFYVFAITPPPLTETHVTRFGIESAGILMRWDILSHYYFVKRFGYTVLVTVTHGPYFAHSYFVVPDETTKRQLMEILNKHLMYMNQPPRTFTDRLIDLFSKLVPEDEVMVTQPV